MKKMLLVVGLLSCGSEWTECPSCRPGEDSAQGADGAQIPIEVNVSVNVNQNQGQNQTQGQTQGGIATPADSGFLTDAGSIDAGTPAGVDGGPRDSGVSAPPDAGRVCRRVCTSCVTRFVCNDGRDVLNKSDCKCGVRKSYNKCLKEVVKCL